jgi:4-amino-4-deoxy-L-arabinose transferase-like glycosyltransferase
VTTTEPARAERSRAAATAQHPGRWYVWLGLIALGGTVIPVTWILRSKHPYGFNDAWYFYYQARFIFSGVGWFVSPFTYIDRHVVVPGASHPPLWTMMLVFAYAIGLKTYVAQLLGACAVGAAAVFMTGLVAREVAGNRAGLIAAVVAALYPNYWINFGLGLGETVLLLIIGAVLLVAIRFWRRPSMWGAATLGLLGALAALTRAEQILLLVLVFVPLALVVRETTPRRRVAFIGVGLATALVVLAPWVGFNLARFDKPTYLSTDSGSTVASANCGPTYSGRWLGYEDVFCLSHVTPQTLDESVADAQLRHVGLAYARAHITRVPIVVVARAARELGLFKPLQQLRLEQEINGRPYGPAFIGLLMFYALSLLSILGAITLRRRRVTLVPFLGILVGVVITAMLTFGETRYRVPLDVVVVILGAVALDYVLPKRRRRAVLGPPSAPLADPG